MNFSQNKENKMSVSKYQERAEYLEQLGKNQEQSASNAREVEKFLRRHESDGLIVCDANRSIVHQYFHGDDITEEALEDSWDTHPNFKKSLAQRESDADVRANLAKEIYTLAPGSPESKNHVVSQLKYKLTEEIIAQRDELRRRKALKDLPKDTLRELARTPLQAEFRPVEPLYQSKERILSASPSEIRRLIRVSGLDAINEVLSRKEKN
jgi:hypothetical protein